MKRIDFRSDTLTKPSKAMRACMADAEVGDDFFREDPTIRQIEDYAAELLGKQSALFVLSGTMGNLISVRSQVAPGSAAIVGNTSHLHINETGHLASICGISSHPLATPAGQYSIKALEAFAAVPVKNKRPSVLNSILKLICVENTHNAEGGRCLDVDYLKQLRKFSTDRGLVFHMDGARVFNAAVSLGRKPAEVVAPVDSVSFCLSKGLGAPGGAIVAGDSDFIEEARHWRQMVGGGMRQSGIMAAAGLMALKQNIEHLAVDHDNAKKLAQGLRAAGLKVDVENVETNIVMAYLPAEFGDPKTFHAQLAAAGVFTLPPKGNRLRFVTHRDLAAGDVEEALPRIREIIGTLAKETALL